VSTATIEEFQKGAAAFLAAVERGDQVVIKRGQKPIDRVLPIEDESAPDTLREEWDRAALTSLSRAYGSDEPEYRAEMIVEPNPDYLP